jgi:hypothetical protein
MTKDDIIRMAHKAGGYTTERYPDEWRLDVDDLDRFANLVAAEEREAIEQRIHKLDITLHTRLYVINHAIRARSENEQS